MICHRLERISAQYRIFAKSHRRLEYPKHSWPLRNASRPVSPVSRANHNGLQSQYDCIFILGGGLKEDGTLPDWVISRLNLGAQILQQQAEECMILCLGGGTPHKPAITVNGHVLHEAVACADFLLEKGIGAERILKETSSYDTVGNGYFATTIHALPAQWRTCALVTSNFHLARSRAVFSKCFELANSSQQAGAGKLQLSCYGAEDDDVMSEEVLRARTEKELQSLKEWQAAAESLPSLQALHRWLHQTHLCYSVTRQAELMANARVKENPVLLASY